MGHDDALRNLLAKHGYEKVRTVGEGSFGKALLVRRTCSPTPLASDDERAVVKVVDLKRASRSERENALREAEVLKSLKHPNIVRYRGGFLADGWLCIAMDYCEGGDLSARIKNYQKQGKTFSRDQVIRWLSQALLALKYIHERHILHRDLKSSNFFLSKRDNLKLGDFGIAKVLDSTMACAKTQIGTPYYMSPELCNGLSYSWSSDIWSLGCIVFEMCSRRVPFQAHDLKSLVSKITKGQIPDLSMEYKELQPVYQKMLSKDPNARPRAAEILKLPGIEEMALRLTKEEASNKEPSVPPIAPLQSADGSCSASALVRGGSVEYYSETHGDWLPAVIKDVDEKGRVKLDVKPSTWLSADIQAKRLRPRTASDARPPSARRPPLNDRPGENCDGLVPPRQSSIPRPPSARGGDARQALGLARPRSADPATREVPSSWRRPMSANGCEGRAPVSARESPRDSSARGRRMSARGAGGGSGVDAPPIPIPRPSSVPRLVPQPSPRLERQPSRADSPSSRVQPGKGGKETGIVPQSALRAHLSVATPCRNR
eukprot:TRINITY_DN40864_c0_g1_i1.p1 TRINITY_DN40864_c0_g1~~TRINITY_DN40864_c0_g1_i1.p1  ORF type:complete len:570 (-),score=54.29 TRINITY_DN40864_c0_g1_i1:358-1995(-)